jgi:4-hydroxy 2-oxovalerate aldolase
MQILDCTLRDGGYYTNWDFDSELVKNYINSFNQLPIDYLEVGYRSVPLKDYLGEYFYCAVDTLQILKSLSKKKLAIILNEKDIRANDAEKLLKPIEGLVDLVRIAVDPVNFNRALSLAKSVRALGFEVALNVMYMSKWSANKEFLNLLSKMDKIVDYFYMVDSFGGVYPKEVMDTISLVRSKTSVKLGFHGHNNLEMALANTLAAIDAGIDIVDATITGMGRGAGNLKTELLLTTLNSKGVIDFPYNELSKVVDDFTFLQQKHGWGTNLPYMFSGANSLPQKQVMEWVSKRYYSFNSIIRALNNQSKGRLDNTRLQSLDFNKEKSCSGVLIIGGGQNAIIHSRAIKRFLSNNPEIIVIHASSKNALSFLNISNAQYFCLIGNEGHRLEEIFKEKHIVGKCILPPYPRKMGTYIPNAMLDNAYELERIMFADQYLDSHTALSIQTALSLKAKTIYISGYDGYSGNNIAEKEQELFIENQYLFAKAKNSYDLDILSLTPTKYPELSEVSVYSMI